MINAELPQARLAASAKVKVQMHIYPHDQVKLVAHFQHKPTLAKQFVL